MPRGKDPVNRPADCPGLSLRPAREEDRVFLWNVHREAMGEQVEGAWGWNEDELLQRFLGGLDLPLTQVIRRRRKDVGFLVVSESQGEIFLRQISIRPSSQGEGIGTAVIRLLLERGARENRPVCLLVFKESRARRLYERLGFIVIEGTEKHYRMRWSPQSGPRRGATQH